MGFTLAFGAMFSKVWRVHRFTTKAKTDPKVSYRRFLSTPFNSCHMQKKVEPWKLYTMVSGLLVVDIVILLTWQLQDPLARRLETFPLEDPISANDDVKIRPELEHCESENNPVWLGEYAHNSESLLKVSTSTLLLLLLLYVDDKVYEIKWSFPQTDGAACSPKAEWHTMYTNNDDRIDNLLSAKTFH